MQKFPKVFTLMSAIFALTFCAVSCKTDDDDEPTLYTVTVASSIEHGKVSVDKSLAGAGTTIKLTATADEGYQLDSYSVKDASSNAITVTDGTFAMPKSNVTVSATFKETAVTPQKTAGNLKTGGAINSILVSLCNDGYGYPACTKFARSETNKDEATLYLDTEGKYIPVWSKGTEVYYYVPDGCTPVMNEDSSKMFSGCEGLTSLDLSKFDTSKVTNMSDMFVGCSGLTSLDVTGFDTSNVKSMKNMFSGCSKLTSLDLSKFVTSNVTDMSVMFYGCEGLNTIYATDKFVTTSVTSGDYCFYNCSKLRGGASTTYDYFRTSADYARIDGGNSAPGYFTAKATTIGTKSKPDAVGDIVFSDGSATPYTTDLTEEQKSKAVAVIYYAGSAEDVLGAKTLGVGLKNTGTDSTLAWARYTSSDDKAEGYSTKITAIQCTPSEYGTGKAATATFTDDTDGSDNWQALCDAVSDEGTSGNYPAWEWVNAYATTSLTGDYASGWYLPTVAELSMLCRVKDTVNSALEKAGGTKITDAPYWSSSQSASKLDKAWGVRFADGFLYNSSKSNDVLSVCTVRAF